MKYRLISASALLALLLVEGGQARQDALPQVDGSAIPLNKYKVKSLKALIAGVPPASCAEWVYSHCSKNERRRKVQKSSRRETML